MKTKVKYALQTNLNQAFNPSPYQDGCEQHRWLLDTEYDGSTQYERFQRKMKWLLVIL